MTARSADKPEPADVADPVSGRKHRGEDPNVGIPETRAA